VFGDSSGVDVFTVHGPDDVDGNLVKHFVVGFGLGSLADFGRPDRFSLRIEDGGMFRLQGAHQIRDAADRRRQQRYDRVRRATETGAQDLLVMSDQLRKPRVKQLQQVFGVNDS